VTISKDFATWKKSYRSVPLALKTPIAPFCFVYNAAIINWRSSSLHFVIPPRRTPGQCELAFAHKTSRQINRFIVLGVGDGAEPEAVRPESPHLAPDDRFSFVGRFSRFDRSGNQMMSGGDLTELDRFRSYDQHRQIIKAFYRASANALNCGEIVAVFDWAYGDQQLSKSVHRTSAMERRTLCSGWSGRSSVRIRWSR
jgi:hypothetical protein